MALEILWEVTFIEILFYFSYFPYFVWFFRHSARNEIEIWQMENFPKKKHSTRECELKDENKILRTSLNEKILSSLCFRTLSFSLFYINDFPLHSSKMFRMYVHLHKRFSHYFLFCMWGNEEKSRTRMCDMLVVALNETFAV